ncbi:MAG: hypothetical protein DWG81_03300 [Chloroflexi bacterium]|nr:hypothetical protein [Chloroflexota bacterium]
MGEAPVTAAEPEAAARSWLQQVRLPYLLLLAPPALTLALALLLVAGANLLPQRVALQLGAGGKPDVYGAAQDLLLLPFGGLLIWLVNTALGLLLNTVARLRPAAMALWIGSAVVQLLLAAASIRLLLAG